MFLQHLSEEACFSSTVTKDKPKQPRLTRCKRKDGKSSLLNPLLVQQARTLPQSRRLKNAARNFKARTGPVRTWAESHPVPFLGDYPSGVEIIVPFLVVPGT